MACCIDSDVDTARLGPSPLGICVITLLLADSMVSDLVEVAGLRPTVTMIGYSPGNT
jgi:hypothetical protein